MGLEAFPFLFSRRGVLRLPSKRDTARKLPVVFKSSWRVEMARQARGRGDVALDGQASSLYFKARVAPLRATIGGSAPSGAPPQTSGCWWSRGPRVPIGRSSTELVIRRIYPDNILTLRCPFKDSERSARCWVPFSPGHFVD